MPFGRGGLARAREGKALVFHGKKKDYHLRVFVAAIIEKLKSEITRQMVTRGEGTGTLSRILSNAGILLIVFLLAMLVEDELFTPALILILLGFTHFGHFVMLGLGIYFLLVGYWKGVLILLLTWIIQASSVQFGIKNIKKNLFSNKTQIDPFEGMIDLLPIVVLQSIFLFFALITSGIMSITFWVLFVLVTLFEAMRFYYRLSSPWRRLHKPVMYRYAAVAGEESACALSEGREFDVASSLKRLEKNIFPDSSDETIQEHIDVLRDKMRRFSDRDLLEKEFKDAYPNIDNVTLKEVLDKVADLLNDPKESGLFVRWFVAELIERDYGKEERGKYLRSVILGRAD